MPRSSKKCACCGDIMHFGGKGMTLKIWAKRKYCSRLCGAANRAIDFESRSTFEFNVSDPFFRFISGRNMLDVRSRLIS